jgi:hypothetical protein
MCVLRARLLAKNETTGSTSTAKGHHADQGPRRRDDRVQDPNQHPEPGDIHRRAHPQGARGGSRADRSAVVRGAVPPTGARQIKQSGTATPNAGTTGAALCQDPSAYYVNYHTTAFPGGAIRVSCTSRSSPRCRCIRDAAVAERSRSARRHRWRYESRKRESERKSPFCRSFMHSMDSLARAGLDGIVDADGASKALDRR